MWMFQSEHPSLVKEYEKHKQAFFDNAKTLKRKRDDEPSSPKQSKLKLFPPAHVLQGDVDKLVTNYIVASMSPLYTVEKPEFIQLIKGLSQGKQVITRKTLSGRINVKYDAMIAKLTDKLSAAKFVCTTADIWSANNKSFMGMTVHWLNDDLKRESAGLACQRFQGSHTYDRIAEIIAAIHRKFDLDVSKVVTTVTDNASNFRKAFSEYMVTEVETNSESDHTDANMTTNADSSDDDDDATASVIQDNASYVHLDVCSALTEGADEDEFCAIQLPPHTKCICHSLNLIATTDADKAIKNAQYGKYHHSVMGKCQAVWNAVHRSSKAADSVEAILCDNKKLLIPCQTRWNSKYDAIARLLELKENLDKICEALKLPKFARTEMEFLAEYKATVEPLAITLDGLQGDEHCYYGMLLPKLTQLRYRLEKLHMSTLQYCGALVNALLVGLTTRFQQFWQLEISDVIVREAVLAAVAHPQYKLKWLPPDKRDNVTQLFLNSVIRLNSASGAAVTTAAAVNTDDDYGYEETTPAQNVMQNFEQVTVMQYLTDNDVTVETLHKYNVVKQMFLRFNASLPSSAPVERLFSVAGLIETPRRNRLSDKMFEKLTLLTLNHGIN